MDFVEFYKQTKMLPGLQTASLEDVSSRRCYLLRQLGLNPYFFRGRDILEVGPGAGVNALVNLSFVPAVYDLVEPDHHSCENLSNAFNSSVGSAPTMRWEVINSRLEEFNGDRLYDFVICEATLPMQFDPVGLLRKVCQFCKVGGMVLITCSDEMSILSETLRRFLSRIILHDKVNVENASKLEAVFANHLSTIEGMSRPAWHYVLDNYVQPLQGRKMLSIAQAIEAVGNEFVISHVMPPTVQIWEWYKRMGVRCEMRTNELGVLSYWDFMHTLADYRTVDLRKRSATNRLLFEKAKDLYLIVNEPDEFPLPIAVPRVFSIVSEIREIAKMEGLTFLKSLTDFERVLTAMVDSSDVAKSINFGDFRSWFGSGQQHLSFVRYR